MAEEGDTKQKRRPKALLEGLADFKILGKVSLNLRVFLEPIGILKFILIFTALFALALTAGFGSRGDDNRTSCQNGNTTYSLTMTFSYPYHPPGYSFTYDPDIPSNSSSSCFTSTERQVFTGSAEYFVAMSSFSFVFAILSFPFYFVFYVPRYDLAKYLSIIDLIITCLLFFFYVFADIAWSAGIDQLNSFHDQLLSERRSACLGNICQREDDSPSPKIQSSVQLSFSALFGWVSMMVLAACIWFIYKDTIVHQERMGPLYHLTCISRRARSREETYQPDTDKYTEKKDVDPQQEDNHTEEAAESGAAP